MPVFQYTARTLKGDLVNDKIDLPTRDDVIAHLRKNRMVVVQVREAKGRQAARADLRIRPTVQGAALVLENETGRILAMAGGFSYPASQLNRVVQSLRQPGSTLKPLTYLAAVADKGPAPDQSFEAFIGTITLELFPPINRENLPDRDILLP